MNLLSKCFCTTKIKPEVIPSKDVEIRPVNDKEKLKIAERLEFIKLMNKLSDIDAENQGS
tara:strand:- start:866 stop:1045 length:180 start_codon:yes stop_codon:yes gene_type:complete